MKYLLLFLIVFGFIFAFAQEVPTALRDGEIQVTLKDGNQYYFSTNEYMVVKRGVRKNKKVLVAEEKKSSKEEEHSNTVIAHVGQGPDGLRSSTSGSTTVVSTKASPVAGVTYCRTNKQGAGVCGTGLTNDTYLFGIKLDF